jgi:hypothetical protein
VSSKFSLLVLGEANNKASLRLPGSEAQLMCWMPCITLWASRHDPACQDSACTGGHNTLQAHLTTAPLTRSAGGSVWYNSAVLLAPRSPNPARLDLPQLALTRKQPSLSGRVGCLQPVMLPRLQPKAPCTITLNPRTQLSRNAANRCNWSKTKPSGTT